MSSLCDTFDNKNEVSFSNLTFDAEQKYIKAHKDFILAKKRLTKIRYVEKCMKYLENTEFPKTDNDEIFMNGIISCAHYIHYKKLLQKNKKEASRLSDVMTTKVPEHEILTYENKHNFSINQKI